MDHEALDVGEQLHPCGLLGVDIRVLEGCDGSTLKGPRVMVS
jgi:hypothetical protein